MKTRGGISLAGLTNRSYPDSAPDDCAHDVVYTKLPAYKSWIARSEKKLESNSPSNSFRKRMKNPGSSKMASIGNYRNVNGRVVVSGQVN